jgi:hypothetical protein
MSSADLVRRIILSQRRLLEFASFVNHLVMALFVKNAFSLGDFRGSMLRCIRSNRCPPAGERSARVGGAFGVTARSRRFNSVLLGLLRVLVPVKAGRRVERQAVRNKGGAGSNPAFASRGPTGAGDRFAVHALSRDLHDREVRRSELHGR